MVFQYPIGWLSDRYDRRFLIIGVSAICALAAAGGLFLGNNYSALVFTAFMIGGMSNPLYSLQLAYVNDYLDTDQMPAASGGLLFINGLGAMTGPILVGYAMSELGNHWFFITIAAIMAITCVYGIYRITQCSYDIAPEDTAPHVAVTSRTTAVGAEFAIEAADEAQLELLEEADEADEPSAWDYYESDVIERYDLLSNRKA